MIGAVPIALRARRIALVAALAMLVPVLVSYLSAVVGPSDTGLGIRSVEWLRDNGAAALVASVETDYYKLNAPGKGGPGLRALPRVGYAGTTAAAPTAAGRATTGRVGLPAPAALPYRPPRVAPMIAPALPGEGVWRPTRSSFGPHAALLVTTLRDQPDYPRVVAGLAWIDPHRTRVALIPGRVQPTVSLPSRPMEVVPGQRRHLLSTFNSGFKLADSQGGFALAGHTYVPLRDGEATLVGYHDGRMDVVSWNGGPTAGADVAFARQNLPLIVNGGRPTAAISDSALWGTTVGNAVLVWRSGIGVDRSGDLIYAAGDLQTAESLARVLARAGAVRAMELDINSYWVSFITYGATNAGAPVNLLPNMNRSSSRYLSPDDRDFFAVFARG